MHVDIAIGAIFRTQAAADAPILDDDFQRITAADRTHRAADHAQWVETLAAGRGNQVVIKAQAFAHEARNSVVSIRAGSDACVATRAGVQVEQQQALRFHQTLLQETVERRAIDRSQALFIHFRAFVAGVFEFAAHSGELTGHAAEIFRANAHHLHVIESRAGSGAHGLVQQRRFSEVFATRKVS